MKANSNRLDSIVHTNKDIGIKLKRSYMFSTPEQKKQSNKKKKHDEQAGRNKKWKREWEKIQNDY